MGVPRDSLPKWDDLQFVVGQLAKLPLLDDEPVTTELIIGPNAEKPLRLDIPLFVSDMSFGALSEEAKVALAKGAELAGTGICSGEGVSWDKVEKTQAFHFKGGQGAKTGTGGHLPGDKVKGKIAAVRGLEEGQTAISPPRFPDWTEVSQYRDFASEVRERTGGIPVGFKLSAQHIEKDIDAALDAGVDYIILDGRGGGTGAAPLIFRDNISVPTIPAIQAIGCLGMRACHTNNCPVGIATQKPHLRERLPVELAAERLARFFQASVELMTVIARAAGHRHLDDLHIDDLTTFMRDMADLTGVAYGGVAAR